jgi:uncharacterized protein (TIGR02453 family)
MPAEGDAMTFTGFPASAVTFYERLEADNSKAFWEKNKAEYTESIREPMLALLGDLETEFGAGRVFRPQRDIRFSADKSPYKTHQGGFVEVQSGVGLYVQISADGLLAAGGYHSHTPEQVARYRRAVDDPVVGDRLARLVADLRTAGLKVGGDMLKTRPRGFPADHPRLDLLRHRSLTAERFWPPVPWLQTPAALDRVREVWRLLVPLCTWLSDHVGGAEMAGRVR